MKQRLLFAIYASGPWAHLFDGTVVQNYIFHVIQHAASAEQERLLLRSRVFTLSLRL